VTTIDTAAPWRARNMVARASAFAAVMFGLAGCASNTNLLSAFQTPSATAPGTETAALPAPAVSLQKSRIAIAPVIGAPETVARQLQGQLAATLEQRGGIIAKTPSDKSDFTLRGYIVSAREKTSVKVSYIWDVTDTAGKRVNRITGEEIVSGAQGKDPWAVMTPQVSQTVADKTAASLVAWLPSQGQIASAAPGNVQVATNAPDVPLPAGASSGLSGPVKTMVPSIAGAPGDGGSSLKTAIERELSRAGVSLAASQGADVYKVEGVVAMGQGKDGKQAIQIDWNVKDPAGKKLGTVSQKNEIPQGSLDGPWGKTADAAAAAASQGILKLLPQAKGVN